MKPFLAMLALAGAAPAVAQGVSLHAFECGRLVQNDLGRFSDTFRFQGERRELVAGCFLIRHPKGMLLWDTGLTPDLIGATNGPAGMSLKQSIPDRLKALGLTPAQITYVGISHHHADHTGGAKDFSDAELLIGKGDLDALKAMKPDDRAPAQLTHWLTGQGKVTPVTGDKDVFGDGSVIMLAMPGHTPGHSALLVKLASGYVLLSGDEYHFRENRAANGVPTFNWNRADTLASHKRFEEIAANLKARVVIQHDARDLGELPAFPAALK
ncbi:N-acyl homoserine lactonase family protein [Sphingomonas sp. ID1715]|nr:N-acyl homoserine lactonase family protein [Sphingomonas sp. ID1715]